MKEKKTENMIYETRTPGIRHVSTIRARPTRLVFIIFLFRPPAPLKFPCISYVYALASSVRQGRNKKRKKKQNERENLKKRRLRLLEWVETPTASTVAWTQRGPRSCAPFYCIFMTLRQPRPRLFVSVLPQLYVYIYIFISYTFVYSHSSFTRDKSFGESSEFVGETAVICGENFYNTLDGI